MASGTSGLDWTPVSISGQLCSRRQVALSVPDSRSERRGHSEGEAFGSAPLFSGSLGLLGLVHARPLGCKGLGVESRTKQTLCFEVTFRIQV